MMIIIVNVLVKNDERTTTMKARHGDLLTNVIQTEFVFQTNAFTSTTSTTTTMSGRLVWSIVSNLH